MKKRAAHRGERRGGRAGVSLRGIPVNKRIHDFVLKKITSGAWAPKKRLPSEHELTRLFGVSRMTVRQGLQELCREGVLKSVQGLGTFVSRPSTHLTIVKVQDIAEEIRARGGAHSCQIIKRARRASTAQEAARFGIRAGASLFHLVAVHFEDATPVELEDRLVNPAAAPDFLAADLLGQTAFTYLMELFPYPEGEHVIRAIRPSAPVIRQLHLRQGEPCLELERITRIKGNVVTIVRLVNPGLRYALHGTISRR